METRRNFRKALLGVAGGTAATAVEGKTATTVHATPPCMCGVAKDAERLGLKFQPMTLTTYLLSFFHNQLFAGGFLLMVSGDGHRFALEIGEKKVSMAQVQARLIEMSGPEAR